MCVVLLWVEQDAHTPQSCRFNSTCKSHHVKSMFDFLLVLLMIRPAWLRENPSSCSLTGMNVHIVTPIKCSRTDQSRSIVRSHVGVCFPFRHIFGLFHRHTHFVFQDTHTHIHTDSGRAGEECVTLSLSGPSERQGLPLEAAAYLEESLRRDKEANSVLMKRMLSL